MIDHKYPTVHERAEEIKVAVTDSNLNYATKRIMDLVKDFSGKKEYLQEAIVLRAKFIDIATERRRTGYTKEVDSRQTEFSFKILEFTDMIAEESAHLGN